MSDVAQWFSPLGRCRCGCGKSATGTLHSYYQNTNLGPYTQRCAESLIKKAHKLKKFEPDCVVREREKR
jgi:hypothetical protein